MFNDNDIKNIVDLYDENLSGDKIGKLYGVCHDTVFKILKKHSTKYNNRKFLTIDNFMESVSIGKPHECWLPFKNTDNQGRFRVCYNAKVWRGHTLKYFVEFGSWEKGLEILHWCDEVLCCNPGHLFVGTKENLDYRFIQRFYRNIEVNPTRECLVYKGWLDEKGYGIVNFRGKLRRASRFVWELYNGKIPKGQIIRHYVCDNPPCVNINHLRIGTHKDNANDRDSKGRQNHISKLEPHEVLEIKRRLNLGEKQRDLSNEYNISDNMISAIHTNVAWKHLLIK